VIKKGKINIAFFFGLFHFFSSKVGSHAFGIECHAAPDGFLINSSSFAELE